MLWLRCWGIHDETSTDIEWVARLVRNRFTSYFDLPKWTFELVISIFPWLVFYRSLGGIVAFLLWISIYQAVPVCPESV
jgi:hypothetical protein